MIKGIARVAAGGPTCAACAAEEDGVLVGLPALLKKNSATPTHAAGHDDQERDEVI